MATQKKKFQKKITTVPNQRIITINKEQGSKNNLYTTNVLNNLNEAMQELEGKASFKLYMYLAQNQDGYEMALSSSDFFDKASCGNTAYTTAFEELVKKGYLVQSMYQSNKYNFYDKARETKELAKMQEKEEIEKRFREFRELYGF